MWELLLLFVTVFIVIMITGNISLVGECLEQLSGEADTACVEDA